MENTQEIVKAGWVFGNFDGFVGERIYPSWQGALEGKRLILRDVRILGSQFIIHDPWKNQIVASLNDLQAVEEYILKNGKLIEPGANVWD